MVEKMRYNMSAYYFFQAQMKEVEALHQTRLREIEANVEKARETMPSLLEQLQTQRRQLVWLRDNAYTTAHERSRMEEILAVDEKIWKLREKAS